MRQFWFKTELKSKLRRYIYHYLLSPISLWILTHWGRVTHICVSKLTIIVSDNGLSPGRRQAIIWNNAGILLIRPLGTNFSEILIKIYTFSFKKIHLNMSSGKWRPSCLGLNVLTHLLDKMATIFRKYGGVEGPPHIFFRHHAISYGWHSNSSVGDSNYCYVIRRTY